MKPKLAYPMDQALTAVRKGKMNQTEAAKEFHVNRCVLSSLCKALGYKATKGRPRKSNRQEKE